MARWIFVLVAFTTSTSSALISMPEIKVNERLKFEDLDFLGELFARAKVSKVMRCEITAKMSETRRQFKDTTVLIKDLEIEFFPYSYDSEHKKIVLFPGQLYGRRFISHSTEGLVEEFRIEVGNALQTFMKFSHDGQGIVTGFVYGDIYGIYPCMAQ